jgi:hypothetical protein
VARGPGYTVFLTGGDAVLVVAPGPSTGHPIVDRRRQVPAPPGSSSVVRMKLLDADLPAVPAAQEPLRGVVNVYRGPDPVRWRTGIPTFGKIRYRGVYPGIDLVYYGTQGRLEYDFVVAPGGDPTKIRLAFEGATRLTLEPGGDLVLETGARPLRVRRPVAYQEIGDRRVTVDVRFEVSDVVAIRVGDYDAAHSLVIDPVIDGHYAEFGTGATYDVIQGLAVDPVSDEIVVTGYTNSDEFPHTHGSFQGSLDVFVMRLANAPDGFETVFSTLFGGTGFEIPHAVTVGADQRAHVVGITQGTLPGADPAERGADLTDGFYARFAPTGELEFTRYLGGDGWDTAAAIKVLGEDVVVGGWTQSPGFLGAGGYVANEDMFVARLTTSGDVVWVRLFGGPGTDWVADLAVHLGVVAAAGATTSSPFLGTSGVPDDQDGIVLLLDAATGSLLWATRLQGPGPDSAGAVAIGRQPTPEVFVAGGTSSSSFLGLPTRGGQDVFVARLALGNGAVIDQARIGGAGDDGAGAIAVDDIGVAYLTGYTDSLLGFPGEFFEPHEPPDFLSYSEAVRYDAYLAQFVLDAGISLQLGYVGFPRSAAAASKNKQGFGVGLDRAGMAYVAGFALFEGDSTTQAFVARVPPRRPRINHEGLTPNSSIALGPTFTLGVSGSGFTGSTEVVWRATTVLARHPTLVSTDRIIYVLVPDSLIGSSLADVRTRNGEVVSDPAYFNIVQVTPDSAPVGSGDVVVVLTGGAFTHAYRPAGFTDPVDTQVFFTPEGGSPQELAVDFSGCTADALCTTIHATIPASLLTSPGTGQLAFTALFRPVTFRSSLVDSRFVTGLNPARPLTFTIAPAVTIAATTPTVAESGPGTGQFTVTRTGPTTAALVVGYTVAGAATPGSDYTALAGTVTIPAGASTAPIPVVPVGDTEVEGPETVVVTLASGAGYVVGSPGSATVTIVDDDSALPDLVVTAVSNPPPVKVIKEKFSVTDTTRNVGGATAGSSRTRYYLSADAARGPGDKLLSGARSIGELAAGAASTGSRMVTIPATTKPGVYFLLACADDQQAVGEAGEGNNCLASTTQVDVRAPDLATTAVSDPPGSIARGGSFGVTDSVTNQGNAAADPSTARYYLSVDKKKGATDVLLTGTRAVPALGPTVTSSGATTVTVPGTAPTGAFYLLACADDTKQVAESDEKDNCRASTNAVTVTP